MAVLVITTTKSNFKRRGLTRVKDERFKGCSDHLIEDRILASERSLFKRAIIKTRGIIFYYSLTVTFLLLLLLVLVSMTVIMTVMLAEYRKEHQTVIKAAMIGEIN
jgi:hypothetical protein